MEMARQILNRAPVTVIRLLQFLLIALPLAGSQTCDDNPLANNGVKISIEASTSCMRGRTPDMTDIGSCHENAAFGVRLPFAFKFLDRSYQNNVFVGSNSYVTFGGSSTLAFSLGPNRPAFPTLFVGGRDNAMRNLSVGPDPLGWRLRYEGFSTSLLSTAHCGQSFSRTIVWELLFSFDGALRLCTGTVLNAVGISAVTDGVSNFYMQKFSLTPSTLYTIRTGLRPCECDQNPQTNKGVKIISSPSSSCMKGITSDMTTVRNCARGGSSSIQLPFPIQFLGKTYGGQPNNVYVGDSSFVTFGGRDGTYFSSFGPQFSALPSILIGSRQNVIKTLAVGPDARGWRVRYEGWSHHAASSLPDLLHVGQVFSCPTSLSSLPTNITWELLFLYDGTLELCTGSELGNLDPVFDSMQINDRFCSQFTSTQATQQHLCTNYFKNLSATNAISDGESASFVKEFVLAPSTLFTISTGLRPCPCDSHPKNNKGVKIDSQPASSCLNARSKDFVDVAHCQDNNFFSAQVPFPVQFLGVQYNGSDVFVGANSFVSFGRGSSSYFPPTFQFPPALLIGTRDNALRTLSVGPDPLGWRIRFEGWYRLTSTNATINCSRPAEIIWELVFLYNSTILLCTSSAMNNIDDAQSPIPMNAIWSGSSYIQNFSLGRTTLYTISTGLFPCTIDISLSVPIASANGSSLTARIPINVNTERADLMTAIITLQGAGFSCASNARVMLETLPPSSQSYGVANIANHQDIAPLLTISMFGLENVTLLSVTLPSVTVPFLPQSFRENISFALLSATQQIIFRSDTGFLDEIFSPMSIDVGQPVLQLQNNAIRSSTTIGIMLTPNQMSIPKAMNPSILVITMFGAGWTLPPTQNGAILAPLSGVFEGAVIESKVNSTSVLRVFFSKVGPINASSPLSLSIFAVVTANVTQPANFSIRSAILNSEGSIIAIGSSGVLDSLVASTMGDSSPAVTFSCPLASASTSRIDVTFSPKTQYMDRINVPSTITVTLVGSGFSCANGSVLKFISPFDGLGSNFSIESQIERSVLRVRMTAGTISPGTLIWFQLGPCSTPRFVQTKLSNLSAAMTDSSNLVVAASTSGTLSSVVEGLGPLSILLNGSKFDMTLTPRQSISSGSSIKITLAGVGLVSEGASPLLFDQAASNASGMTWLVSDPSGTVVTMRFSADVSAGRTIVCSVSPLYGSCPTNIGNITAILSDASGNILSATESSSYHALTTSNMVTVHEFIAASTNGIVLIPKGLYAGKCNCNSTINKTFPARMPGAGVEMIGSAGRTTIDCSGTGMRCLFVQGTSIKIIDIVFKGGSSPQFLSANFITIIQSKFDAVLQGRETTTTASAYRSNSRKMFLKRTRSLKDAASDVHHVPTPTLGKYRISRKSRRISKQFGSQSSPKFHSDSLIKKRDRRPTPRHLFRQLVPSVQSNSNRQLLQFVGPNSVFTMFQVHSTLAGGCVLVEAFNESVSLHGVSLINCSAVYGGGGFFNTSTFRASNGRAEDNIARQGGGVFIIARQGAVFELFDFLRNTVVTSEASGRQSNTVWSEAMMFTLVPDPVAAAGGGAWLWALSAMTNCKFIGNAALGDSADGTSTARGAHALGSGLYVLQTLNGSTLSNLQFSTSLSMCSGKGCLAAGSMFLAFTGFNTQCETLLFLESKVLSQGSFSESWGASIVVSDASSGMLKISNVQSFNCSAASSGSINGGCMMFPTVLNRSIVSKISIHDFQTNTEIFQDSNGILLAFGFMDNSQISDITVHSINLIYESMWASQTGLVAYVEFLKNSSINSVFVTQLTWRIIEGFGRLRGGVVYIFDMDRDSILQSISVQDSSFIYDLTSEYGDRMFFGWFLYIRSSESASAVILNVSAKNIVASVSGRGIYGANPGSGSRQAMLTAIYLSFPFNKPAGPVVMKDMFFKSISQYCIGPLCQGNALIRTNLDGFQFLYSPPSSIPTFQISDAVFESVANVCEGERCKVRGGCFALSTYSGSLRNVRMVNITLRAIGASANAGGAFLFLIFSNPVKSLLISNVSSSDIRVISEGATSFALGGVIAVLYANLSIDHFRSNNVTISCLGSSCQAVGGAMAFLSAQALSHKRYSHFFANASNVVVSDSVAECSGSNCTAIGGAVFAGLAFRGSWEPNLDGDIISRLGSVILPLNFILNNATISRNEVRSRSVGAMLAGAGVYVLLASVEVLNSKFVQNSMVSSNTSSFVRGAGFCISGPSSRATMLSTEISYNSAGASGLGGGIYAGQNAALTCQSVLINFNTAAKGGGLLNDLAAVHLFNSSFLNNTASDKGGGIFCVVGASHENPASIILSHVIMSNNSIIRVANLAQVGACAYILGKVLVEIRDRTHFMLNGDTKYTTTEAVISTGMRSLIDQTSITSCKGGSVLSVARTDVVSYDVVLAGPNIEEQFASQCTPACLFVPEINENVASSGFMASCVPCPRGTYSLLASSSPSDSVSSQCKPCPFGAVCDGGYNVTASNSYWGWNVSESELTNRFIRLPSGYACKSNCSTIAPCGGHRTGTLCGQCAENYSISFFATECVPSEQCASEKWGLLIFVCLLYQFAFSTWMFWSSESELLRQQSGHRSSAKVALEQIPLLRNLSESNISAIVAKMELVHVDAKTTILVQGQSSVYMYVIKQGILDEFTVDASGKESLKNSLVAPAVVGELSCINGSNCRASVRASMDSDLWKLDRSCFDAVSDEDKRSFVMQANSKQFISNLKNSKRPVVAEKVHVDHVVKEELGSDAFGVLMWFYQLAGIMLSVTSPLSYLDGSAVAYSVVSFFVNSKPSSDAAAELTSNADTSSSTNSNTNSTKYQFCVDATFTVAQVHLTTVMYYVMWAFMMALLSHKSVWKCARNVFCEVIYRLAQLIELVANWYRRSLNKEKIDFFTTHREKFAERQKVDIEIRGPVVLKWLITCFSAVATLMMQGTSCVNLDGLMNSNIVGHWIYDGRVACFSNAGAVSGLWQVASAFGVAAVLVAPAILLRTMQRITRLDKSLRTQLEDTLLQAYSGNYAPNASHWKVVMFYERLIMMLVSVYLTSSPFFQGYTMLCICIVTLVLECTFRPYKSFSMQILSCSSAGFLVAICGLLLRDQALISGARSPNFETKDPSIESKTLSLDLTVSIVFLVLLLAGPAVVTIILASKSKIMALIRHKKHDNVKMGAVVHDTGDDVRLCFFPLSQRWKRWQARKVTPEMEQKAAAVLASAAILHSKQKRLKKISNPSAISEN